MRKSALLVASLLVVACHGSDPATSGTGSESATSTTPKAPDPGSGSSSGVAQSGSGSGETKPTEPKPPEPVKAPEPLAGHEFLPEAKVLLAVGACADNIPPPDSFPKKLLTEHCEGT